MPASLKRLLSPRHVAVVGGSEAEACALQLQKIGFEGAIWPVNPHRERMAGLAVHRDLASLPVAPDACFLGVDRAKSVPLVAELARRGAGGVVCYASGFRESDDADGSALERALIEAAGEMPVLGPNCYGFVNCVDRAVLWADQHGAVPLGIEDRGVAIVSQSSNLAINVSMQRRGLPLAYLLTVGNQAQTGISRLVEEMLDDDRVSAIGLYIEGIDDVRAFESAAARARELAKPIVALKAGHSALARRSMLSHTASVAGSDAASRAFLERVGVAEVSSLETLLETLKLLHVTGPLSGPDIVSLSCSGGEACLIADAARASPLRFPDFSDETAARLHALLGPIVNVANPLDYHTFIWAKREALENVFDAALGDRADLALLLMDFPRSDRCDERDWWVSIDAFSAAIARRGVRGAVVSTLADNMPEQHARLLGERGLAALGGFDSAVDAASAALAIGQAWQQPRPAPVLAAHARNGEQRLLDEHEAKQRLLVHDVPVPCGARATSIDEAIERARRIGYPLAVKALGIAHKTEQQALRLGIGDDAALIDATGALLDRADAVRIERMVRAPIAELLVGAHHDPPYGLVLTIASGGVLVERLNDARSLLLPIDERDVRDALGRLHAGALMNGYRNGARGDVDAAVAAILGIARFAAAHGDSLCELDINPLIVCTEGAGAWAADALMVIKES